MVLLLVPITFLCTAPEWWPVLQTQSRAPSEQIPVPFSDLLHHPCSAAPTSPFSFQRLHLHTNQPPIYYVYIVPYSLSDHSPVGLSLFCASPLLYFVYITAIC